LAGALLGLWLAVYPHTPDLAGQAYRVSLFEEVHFVVWDEHWYAGHDIPGYSLLFPPLAAAIGLRAVACLSALASTVLFAGIARSTYRRAGRSGAVLFAVAAVADVWIGRLAFALGVALALAAVLTLVRGWPLLAFMLAALCSAASPVAGVLLALAGLTHALAGRRLGSALALTLPALAIAAGLAAVFPEGGSEPYPFLSLLATLGVLALFVLALPPRQALLRVGAALYLIACVLSVVAHTPMGSNIERYGVLLAGPLLACAVAARPRRGVLAAGAVTLALLAWGTWVVWGPVREARKVSGPGSEATSAAYYEPVERLFARVPARVEVPLTRSHWEAALLAPSVSLARGWEKQLDERYDSVLLSSGLDAASYRRWLDENAVSYVALPDVPLDSSSAAEGRLIRSGLPYLHEMFASPHWRVYAVANPTPLVSGPAQVVLLGHNRVRLEVFAPATLLLRVRYSRYLTIDTGEGCLARAPGGWTEVVARSAGRLTLRALFSVSRALGHGEPCRA
jgi:hypothetical protein